MKKEETKTYTHYYCDVCGKKLKEDDFGWWQCVTGWDGVVAEYYTPFDLCNLHKSKLDDYFSDNRDECFKKRYVYERYQTEPKLNDDFIQQFKDDIFEYTDYED